MIVDLAHADQAVDALLAEVGRPDWSYSLEAEVWNHRYGGRDLVVTLSVVKDNVCVQGRAGSVEAALVVLRDRLAREPIAEGEPIDVVTPAALPSVAAAPVAVEDDEPF